jgi:hypothetical protein
VDDLSAFLARERFDLSLKGLTLELPDSMKLRSDGELSIYQNWSDPKNRVALAFTVADRKRDPQRGVTTITLRPKDGATLTYRPGDDLNADFPVRDADERALKLTWDRGRSRAFQFQHLVREPRLHVRGAEPQTGIVEPNVHLSVTPGQGSIPRLPDLVPVVKLDKSK